MKTYTENCGVKPFDWNAFLDKETITHREWEKAIDLAGDWVTCACGNQCNVIARDKGDGRPKDQVLIDLGLSFLRHISDKNQLWAKETLGLIEVRAAQLIAEIQVQDTH